jgi:HEPN domain-containing protein
MSAKVEVERLLREAIEHLEVAAWMLRSKKYPLARVQGALEILYEIARRLEGVKP